MLINYDVCTIGPLKVTCKLYIIDNSTAVYVHLDTLIDSSEGLVCKIWFEGINHKYCFMCTTNAEQPKKLLLVIMLD
jgi:hypothetical protein